MNGNTGAAQNGNTDENTERKQNEMKRLKAFIDNKTYLARPFKSDILTPAEIEAAIIAVEWEGYP